MTNAIRQIFECLLPAIDFSVIADEHRDLLKKLIFNVSEENVRSCIPKSMIKKLRSRIFTCKNSPSGVCLRRYPGQIKVSELKVMKRMIEAKKYAHMPICSLALFAKRNGILSFEVHSWYKYASRLRWKRPTRKMPKKYPRYQGLVAKHPHEYWHQDVTKITLEEGLVRCLQVIQDNCSRAILGWQLTSSVKAEDSGRLLLRVKSKVCSRALTQVHLVVDGGPENIGASATIAKDKGMPRVFRRVARREIRHANTMVEAFFKSLKSNFLSHYIFKSEKKLQAAISFYINQHNNAVPKLALEGRTPGEVLSGVRVNTLTDINGQCVPEFRYERNRSNKASSCSKCVNDRLSIFK